MSPALLNPTLPCSTPSTPLQAYHRLPSRSSFPSVSSLSTCRSDGSGAHESRRGEDVVCGDESGREREGPNTVLSSLNASRRKDAGFLRSLGSLSFRSVFLGHFALLFLLSTRPAPGIPPPPSSSSSVHSPTLFFIFPLHAASFLLSLSLSRSLA